MTHQDRINAALSLALAHVKPDPENRYQAAMEKRATEILSRSQTCERAEDALPEPPDELAKAYRRRDLSKADPRDLRRYVEAKLAISNPKHASFKEA